MSAVEQIDWNKVGDPQQEYNIAVAGIYKELIELTTELYQEIEKNNPRVVSLAKAYAKQDYPEPNNINELFFWMPPDLMPVHLVDGRKHASFFSGHRIVPLWSLYLPKAREALELLKDVA